MGEQKITEVIERQRHLQTIDTHLALGKNGPGIIDQHIEALVAVLKRLGEFRSVGL